MVELKIIMRSSNDKTGVIQGFGQLEKYLLAFVSLSDSSRL